MGFVFGAATRHDKCSSIFAQPADSRGDHIFARPIGTTKFAIGASTARLLVFPTLGLPYSHVRRVSRSRGRENIEMTPSEHLTQNETDAANTVHFDYFNAQGQPKLVWPPSFALARAYTDQLERNKCLSAERIASVRQGLASAERASGTARSTALNQMTTQLESDARSSCDGNKVQKLVSSIRDLSNVLP